MKRIFSACLLAVASMSALAVEGFAPTDAEIAVLPPYCAKRLRGTMTPQEGAYYPHVHHYCFGLNFANRAQRARDKTARKFNLESARGEFNYVIQRLETTHWMYPQVQSDMGNILSKLNDSSGALNAFNMALSANPAYERAYMGLIQILQRSGSRSSVLDVASAGLRHLPNSHYLKKVYLDFGGKEPFPEPIVRPTESSKYERQSADRAVGAAESIESSEKRTQSTTGEATESESGRPDTGCRFCPPKEIQERWRETFDSSNRN